MQDITVYGFECTAVESVFPGKLRTSTICAKFNQGECEMGKRFGMRALFFVATLCAALVLPVHRAAAREAQAGSTGTSCDYACLTSMVDLYLKAMAAHDPSRIAVTSGVRFTENTIPLKLGDALWGTMSGMGSYKLYFADVRGGSVGIEATIRENGAPAILLLRLKVANQKISEIEQLVHRNADDAAALEKRGQPDPVWAQPLEPAERVPRAEMVKIVNSYFEGILHSSGDSVPFDPRCNRVLDGFQDTNNPTAKGWFEKGSFNSDALGIRENMNMHLWTYIHSIDPRRFVVVDEKMGIVLAMLMYNHTGTVEFAEVPGVGRIPMPSVARRPSSLAAGEFFKIEGGKIREVEGVTVALPYGAKLGWPYLSARN